MHRRKFLGTVTIGAGFTVLPMWLSRAFGPQQDTCPETGPDPSPAPAAQLQPGPAYAPGTAPFKPLLVHTILMLPTTLPSMIATRCVSSASAAICASEYVIPNGWRSTR